MYREYDQKAVTNIVVTKGPARVTGSCKTGSVALGTADMALLHNPRSGYKPFGFCNS